MLLWLADWRNKRNALRFDIQAREIPKEITIPQPMRWHNVREFGMGISITSQVESAPWPWRAWRAFRYGENWERNPEFDKP